MKLYYSAILFFFGCVIGILLPIEGSGAMLNLEPMSHNRFSLCALGDRSIGVKGDIALGVSQFEIFISIELGFYLGEK